MCNLCPIVSYDVISHKIFFMRKNGKKILSILRISGSV